MTLRLPRRPRWRLWAGLLMVGLGAARLMADDIAIYTVESAPLVMSGDHHGILGDLTLEALRRLGDTGHLIFEPWARSQIDVGLGRNRLIIPLTRSADRESHYLWIYDELDLGRVFVTKGPRIETYEDAHQKLTLISVLNGSVNHSLLKEQGLTDQQINPVSDNLAGLRMLQAGRVDAWFNSDVEARWTVKKEDPTGQYVFGAVLSPSQVFLAASKDCDDRLVIGLRSVLDAMKKDGTYQKIVDQYQ